MAVHAFAKPAGAIDNAGTCVVRGLKQWNDDAPKFAPLQAF
jgi:hypothetical protein